MSPAQEPQEKSSSSILKKRRSEQTRACDRCRRRRIKCYEGHPCQACPTANSPCTFEEPGKRTHPHKSEYEYAYANLKDRVHHLETLIQAIPPSPPPRAITRPFSFSFSSSASIFSTTPSMPSLSTLHLAPLSKSSECSDIERRPKKGDDDYIKRPENAFILFRRKCCEDRQAAREDAALDDPAKKQSSADLAKTISQQWKVLTPEERLYWEELAKEKKKEHEQMYPSYVYRPQRSKDGKVKKGKRVEEGDLESNGRLSSAPTSPPCLAQIAFINHSFPPPPDLTLYLMRIENQYSAGGGFSDVYKCWYEDESTRKEVAVKALRLTIPVKDNPGGAKMLRRELGIWKRLDHVNIVPFLGTAYGFGMSGATSLVSLWMPNGSLYKFLQSHDDTLRTIHRLQFLLDIANGLQYLHSLSVVHGDLNSNNVVVDEDYTLRLVDFGYASLVGNTPEALQYLQMSTTRPGALRWAAPEQLNPDIPSSRTNKSDVYSFGCVLSGKVPWSEVREDMAIAFRLAKGHTPERPTSRTIDDPHWKLIQHCWSRLQERPTIQMILLVIKRFSMECPQSLSLRELLAASSNLTDANETSLSPYQSGLPVDYSDSRAGQIAGAKEGQDTAAPIPATLNVGSRRKLGFGDSRSAEYSDSNARGWKRRRL